MTNMLPPTANFKAMWKMMNRDEKLHTIKIVLLPYSRTIHNVIMWTANTLFLAVVHYMYTFIDHRIFTNASYDIIMIWIYFISMISSLYFVGHRLGAGLTSRRNEIHKKIVEQTQIAMDAYGKEIIEKLKSVSGRDHIDMNPIAMAAAQVDVMNKRDELDPLKRALQQLPKDNV